VDSKGEESRKDQCITMLVQDYFNMVRELKAGCLALGHDNKTCGIIEESKPVTPARPNTPSAD